MKSDKFKVVELFAGVGGFRLGLEKHDFEVIWSNQWEPSTKIQHASMVYEARFGSENHISEDIAKIPTSEIPDHDLLVGGFPCQDYSVATTLKNSNGLRGKKGVLWWSIHRILEEKKNKPKYLLLENVDRLLKSPAKQRGRDFAIMLQSLNQLGYAVEWRVINAAEYGMPQRRRRIFILGYHKTSPIYSKLKNIESQDWILKKGLMAEAFPVTSQGEIQFKHLQGGLVEISEGFNSENKKNPFENSGLMVDGRYGSLKTVSAYDGPIMVLNDVLQNGQVPSEYFLDENDLEKWEYLKGAKTIERQSANGHVYKYSEGGMNYPDPLNKPSRTIITGEGGKSPSRFKHVIHTPKGLRRLTPIELERLNMFPDNHTRLEGISDSKRAFFMGNALVVGVIERLAEVMEKRLKPT